MRWHCNSCDGEYDDTTPDGGRYFHVCPTEHITNFGTVDTKGNVSGQVTERREIRDERPVDGLEFNGAEFTVLVPNPEERGQSLRVPGKYAIHSEGKGRRPIG